MRPFLTTAASAFRISAVTIAAFTGIEAAGFALTGQPFAASDFALALAVGLAGALIYTAIIGALAAAGAVDQITNAKFTSLTVSLAILYLILVLWLRPFSFARCSGWIFLLGLIALLGIMAGLGRFLWLYLNHGAPDLAAARFQALAPVAAISAGLYSVADHVISARHYLALAVLGLLLFLLFGQYFITRFVWGRNRDRFQRWGVRSHALILALVPAAAAIMAGREYQQARRPASAPAGSPSVILITVDTLRSDFLSANNPQAAPTPALDALARDGLRFANAQAPSCWTLPSVAAILTGRYSSAVGGAALIPLGDIFNFTGPVPNALTLAQVLADRGYVTAAFVHNGWLSPDRGFAKGFQLYEIMSDLRLGPQFLVSRGWEIPAQRLRRDPRGPAARLTTRALRWLEHRPAGPFFLWLHYIDPHLPYLTHNQYPPRQKPGPMTAALAKDASSLRIRADSFNLTDQDRLFLRERYEGEVRFTDDEIGRFLAAVKARDLYDPSVIALTADHGEEFWDHGGFEHAHSFHAEVIHVPLIVKLAANRSAGKVITSAVGLTGLGSTLLAAVGLKTEFPGPNLLTEDPGKSDPFWFSENTLYGGELGAIIARDGHKAIFHRDGALTCYDLDQDPQEKTPFPETACPWPPDAPSPRELLQTFHEQNRKIFLSLGGDRAVRQNFTAEEIRSLKALGYLQ